MRKLALALRIGLTTFVLFEIVLQILALGVWLFQAPHRPATVDGDTRVVLCVGDSFTYGCGSSHTDGPYPVQLERILRARAGDAWRVVNLGYPGWNSRQVLEQLDAEIDRLRPELVCVVVGANDTWSLPDELDLADLHERRADPDRDPDRGPTGEPFSWELRTLRFLKICRVLLQSGDTAPGRVGAAAPPGSGPDRPAAVDAPPPDLATALLGDWVASSGDPVRFGADGTGSLAGRAFSWRVADDRLHVSVAGGTALSTDIEPFGPADAPTDLHLRVADSAAAVDLRRADIGDGRPPPHQQMRLAQKASRRGDFAAAEALLAALLDLAPEGSDMEGRALSELVAVRTGSGDADGAARVVERLEQRNRENPSRRHAECLLSALRAAHHEDRALELAARITHDYPDSQPGWTSYAMLSFQVGDLETARAAIDRATALLDDGAAPPWREIVLLDRFRIYRGFDLDEAVDALIRAYLAGRRIEKTRQWLQQLVGRVDAAWYRERVTRLAAAEDARAELLRLYDDLTGAGAEAARGHAERVYRSHLAQMVRRCDAAGAQTAFAGYPGSNATWHGRAAREIALQDGAAWVDVSRAFDLRRQTDPDTELFATDGHCNDRGYRIMAEAIGEVALQVIADRAASGR